MQRNWICWGWVDKFKVKSVDPGRDCLSMTFYAFWLQKLFWELLFYPNFRRDGHSTYFLSQTLINIKFCIKFLTDPIFFLLFIEFSIFSLNETETFHRKFSGRPEKGSIFTHLDGSIMTYLKKQDFLLVHWEKCPRKFKFPGKLSFDPRKHSWQHVTQNWKEKFFYLYIFVKLTPIKVSRLIRDFNRKLKSLHASFFLFFFLMTSIVCEARSFLTLWVEFSLFFCAAGLSAFYDPRAAFLCIKFFRFFYYLPSAKAFKSFSTEIQNHQKSSRIEIYWTQASNSCNRKSKSFFPVRWRRKTFTTRWKVLINAGLSTTMNLCFWGVILGVCLNVMSFFDKGKGRVENTTNCDMGRFKLPKSVN